jgi:hypothetical protein
MAQRSMVSDARSSFPNTRQSHYRKTRYTNRLGSGFVRAPILILAVGEAHGWSGARSDGRFCRRDAYQALSAVPPRVGSQGSCAAQFVAKGEVAVCGIVGYVGLRDAAPILLEGLQR